MRQLLLNLRMNLKYIFLLLLLISGQLVSAQVTEFTTQCERIDSLIFYNHFTEAEKEANSLYYLLSQNLDEKKYEDLKLRVMLYKAEIYVLNKEMSKAGKTALIIIDAAEESNFPEIEYEACLVAALVYEQAGLFISCKKYLDRAYELYKKNKLESVYSMYCIRLSSYYRLTGKADSAVYFANNGLEYARKYKNGRNLADSYMLLNMLLKNSNYKEAINFGLLAANEFLERNAYAAAAAMYSNVTSVYLNRKQFDKALEYNDSAFRLHKNHTLRYAAYSTMSRYRSEIFDNLGNKDSAYFYFKEYHNAYLKALKETESIEIKRITEQYQNDKKEAVIKSQNHQILFIISLLAIIIGGSILLIRSNRKINRQNKIINTQVSDLTKTLEQKQVLLSELQHRVKNNLQHVISILEIQKESVDFNNIDELIRGNQNRIHSIALLHKKLNVSENVNEVNLKKYILELAELVKDSYNSHKKKIRLEVKCEIQEIAIEKALPIGLIVVELVSNSMKHAFRKQNIGIINIVITKEENKEENKLFYTDNGSGFDFYQTNKKGLGMEIIKGLIDQIDATVESNQSNGFELTLCFK